MEHPGYSGDQSHIQGLDLEQICCGIIAWEFENPVFSLLEHVYDGTISEAKGPFNRPGDFNNSTYALPVSSVLPI